eukprot:COSAG05_NODE_3381_length_2097_cov_1.745746_1_plen_34_part_00
MLINLLWRLEIQMKVNDLGATIPELRLGLDPQI